MRTPTFLYLAHKRAVNLKRDLLAVASGYCNATPDTLRGGGYSHWRCARGWWHRGDHRYRNYVWSPHDRAPLYDPQPTDPITHRLLQQPHDRYSIPTIRQTWAKRRFIAAETRRRRAAARAAR